MATQTVPHRTSISNQADQAAALRMAHERLNARLAAGLPTEDCVFVNVDGMTDPGPDFSPCAWNRGR